MSEQGWNAFLDATAADLKDWVVLHGGATAVYRTASITDAANLAASIAALPAAADAILTIAGSRLSIRLTRDLWKLEPHHVELARQITQIARTHNAQPDRAAVQEVQLAIAAKPETIHLDFWRAVLGYAPMAPDNAVDPLGHGSTVWMQEIDSAKPLRHAMHIDVSVARDQVEARLAAALAAGGRIVDESHAPNHWTLSDRAGNRVCICAWPDGVAKEFN
ncbi:hypothetical protein F183_A15980 [Bryobacterales bacterium F-183]|nr:hypothetical protein F183_A15980 [Bryobacterales bacterium F-183]